jgi:hypothetical protein
MLHLTKGKAANLIQLIAVVLALECLFLPNALGAELDLPAFFRSESWRARINEARMPTLTGHGLAMAQTPTGISTEFSGPYMLLQNGNRRATDARAGET